MLACLGAEMEAVEFLGTYHYDLIDNGESNHVSCAGRQLLGWPLPHTTYRDHEGNIHGQVSIQET
jgi:hypothetical protein